MNFFETLIFVKKCIKEENFKNLQNLIEKKLIFYVKTNNQDKKENYFPVQFLNHHILFTILEYERISNFHYKILYYLINFVDFKCFMVVSRMKCALCKGLHKGVRRLVKYCILCGFIPEKDCLLCIRKQNVHRFIKRFHM